MSTYTVETTIRGYHVYREVWEAAIGEVLPCFISLLAEAVLAVSEDGTTVDRRPSGFGSVELG